ncbi:hypothetical protein VSS37_13880 [Candidatus Thiothrix sp. Deng01]|uniref:Lipoprotein n=1 Tax=Candidatus Thiothrix phosphatis TaxID=3112415 RepID=A0ABU6CZ18_9GAMM|nr:hypothetical protein [Candidatus Thiothrix sp. Deng01]MEB4592078.1 hypothetical protein [Candidatus Thiothrix sp. Deng01]
MKIKSQLTLATLIVAGMFATGCQQMSQQTAQQATASTTEAATTTPAQTGACDKSDKWCHTHPPIPGCTNSITHSHPYTNPNHTHTYGCKGGQRPMIPHVKAKGNYKGPIMMDQSSKEVMQQYQK